MESRLRMLAGVLSILFWTLGAAFVATMLRDPDRGALDALIEFATVFPNAMVFLLSVSTTGVYVSLRAHRFSSRGLAWLDFTLLQLLIFPCLVLYERLHTFSFSGFAQESEDGSDNIEFSQGRFRLNNSGAQRFTVVLRDELAAEQAGGGIVVSVHQGGEAVYQGVLSL